MSSQFCPFCHPENKREFLAEVNIHFPGMTNLTKPTVWLFPTLSVCLHCGVAQFDLPDAELERLAEKDSSGQSHKVAA
jgi:hypothetical protein